MLTNSKKIIIALMGLSLSHAALASGSMIKTQTSDGVTVYGEKYFAGLDKKAPLILLFHQAGSNGRGEYGELIPWLNDAGLRVIAWDQRSGGERFGDDNRTRNNMRKGTPSSFCDAYPDLQAALNYTVESGLSDKPMVWGSSYSAALVVQLAAKNADKVSGVLSFSPASGGPMVNCRARTWLDKVTAPMLFLRPKQEMARPSSVEQAKLLKAAGADFKVIEKGVHGSSMLVDRRTKNDMSKVRAKVIKWIKERVNNEGHR